MKKVIFIFFWFSFQTCLFGQNDVGILLDKNASSISSAENLLSIHKIISTFEDTHLKLKYWNENNWKGKSLGIGYRLSKTLFLDFQVDYLTNLIQHEVFGHGGRFREFEYERNSFNLNLAIPFGSMSGYARTGSLPYNRLFGVHERILMRSGGMEANAVFGKKLQQKWIKRGVINYRETLIYLIGFHDYTYYILRTKLFAANETANDVNNYLSVLNENKGYFGSDNYLLSLEDISNRVLINLINTYHLFAIYTYFKVYLFDGNNSLHIPMIKLGKTNWLPSIRFGLTPFGSEFIVENYLKKGNNILGLNLRIGDNKFDNFWGGGLSYFKNFTKNIQISSFADFWIQPSLELGGIKRLDTKNGFGGRFLSEVKMSLNNSFPIGIFSHIGYKSSGYIEGERLDKGLILRIGITVKTNAVSEN